MKRKSKVTMEDMKLEPPNSLREIIEESLYSRDVNATLIGKEVKPLDDDAIDDLMKRVYEKIEREALSTYSSNEPWALRMWALSNILKDEVDNEATNQIAQGLIDPVMEWQKETFDPILNFKRKLRLSNRAEGYITQCMRVAREIVSRYGRKTRYTEGELLEFMDKERKKYRDSTYATRITNLKVFLDSLPEDEHGRKQKLPIAKLPSYPDEFQQPLFTMKEIDSLIYAAVMNEKPDIVLRFCIASIYGCRVGELAKISSQNINLNHGTNPTISIPTQKKGRRLPQPIPQSLLPLFSVPLQPRSNAKIQRDLKRICKRAGVTIDKWTGVHAICRSVITFLYQETDCKEITIARFLRWKIGGHRGLGVMPKYVKTPVEATDLEVLSKHPFIPMWESMVQFIPYLPQYDGYVCDYTQ